MIGSILRPRERELLVQLLIQREGALSWDWTEIGSVHSDVAPPQRILTIEHDAWQAAPFNYPKSLQGEVRKMVKERFDRGTLEPCHGPYRNPWFLVKKKSGGHRMINACLNMNAVTLRDANLPPNVDDFSDEFAGMKITSLIDLFSGYDQISLDKRDRDMTAFMTPIGLLRQTTLPQGATNSVQQFVRIINRVLAEQIPDCAQTFLDDIAVKGPKSNYNDEQYPSDDDRAVFGCRKFVLEHLKNLDQTLLSAELAGLTMSGEKSQFCAEGLKMVGFVIDGDGRHPDVEKISKIVNWPACKNVTEVRAFLGICVYYRVFVVCFAILSAPLYKLLEKDVVFVWKKAHDVAMQAMKEALTSAPALISLDYGSGNIIILAVDASKQGWGAVLMQLIQKKRHPARFESGLWSEAEQKYDAGKLEARGLMKALKKFRNWLYGVRFVLEIDANTLVAQLKQSPSDLPGALITRWLTWIRIFDFDVKHVPGKKHTAADGLSRRPAGEGETLDTEDIDDWIDDQLEKNCSAAMFRSYPATVEDIEELEVGPHLDPPNEEDRHDILDESYTEEWQTLARFLVRFTRPPGLYGKDYRNYRERADRYEVYGDLLYRKASKNIPRKRVIARDEDREKVVREMHDELGHRGEESTYRRVADRYWWPQLFEAVRTYIKTCDQCQRRARVRDHEELHPTYSAVAWQKVALDIVKMPSKNGKTCMLLMRDDLTGWVEGAALSSATALAVADAFEQKIVLTHGCPQELSTDWGPENRSLEEIILQRHKIHHNRSSPHHPEGQGMIERGHKPIIEALARMSDGGYGSWVSLLPKALWADRISVKRSTGRSPFYLVMGREPVLHADLEFTTWQLRNRPDVHTTEDLLEMRMQQIVHRDKDVLEAAHHLQRMREKGKEIFDETHATRSPLSVGDLVLEHNTGRRFKGKYRLEYMWSGPYRIATANAEKGYYGLEELDGTMIEIKKAVAGNRLRRFHLRDVNVPVEELQQRAENTRPPEPDSEDEDAAIPPAERLTDKQIPRNTVRVALPPVPSGTYTRYEN